MYSSTTALVVLLILYVLPIYFSVSSLNTAIFTVGGLVEGKESPLLLIENNVCPDLPALPQRRLAGLLGNLNDSIIFCGGREDLLRLNNECWIYEPKLQEWVRNQTQRSQSTLFEFFFLRHLKKIQKVCIESQERSRTFYGSTHTYMKVLSF